MLEERTWKEKDEVHSRTVLLRRHCFRRLGSHHCCCTLFSLIEPLLRVCRQKSIVGVDAVNYFSYCPGIARSPQPPLSLSLNSVSFTTYFDYCYSCLALLPPSKGVRTPSNRI
ncbi:uncharacterized protein DS421_9g271420 [Arachis hypogaea]|nr:uncharacterized protein DS421_9g271420 [Arachis hypogaea]